MRFEKLIMFDIFDSKVNRAMEVKILFNVFNFGCCMHCVAIIECFPLVDNDWWCQSSSVMFEGDDLRENVLTMRGKFVKPKNIFFKWFLSVHNNDLNIIHYHEAKKNLCMYSSFITAFLCHKNLAQKCCLGSLGKFWWNFFVFFLFFLCLLQLRKLRDCCVDFLCD